MKKYMVIERFKPGCLDTVYDRYHRLGRMLPDGVYYLNSWLSRDANICFQLMEAEAASHFHSWFDRWSDLVDFEIFEID
jgi:Protein of unknown function (DUF3303)